MVLAQLNVYKNAEGKEVKVTSHEWATRFRSQGYVFDSVAESQEAPQATEEPVTTPDTNEEVSQTGEVLRGAQAEAAIQQADAGGEPRRSRDR